MERVIAGTRRSGVALAAWPINDTVKRAHPRPVKNRIFLEDTLSRQNLWLAQTPQGFLRPIADQVFRRVLNNVTDDVQAAEKAGHRVQLVLGDPRNLKVTVPDDLKICEALLKADKL